MTTARVALSTSSVLPAPLPVAFETAAALGYDGVELMVYSDGLSSDVDAVRDLVERHGVPVLAVHSPCLIVTQRVWGVDPLRKLDRSVAAAHVLGAEVVVTHPPFRWQRDAAARFTAEVAEAGDGGVTVAVENMYPWHVARRPVQGYAPGWDPTDFDVEHVTLDLSHTAASGSDALAMADVLAGRLAHVHLADGSGARRDEHLVPGRGAQPCGELLSRLGTAGFGGVVTVEVNTRGASTPEERTADLAESLAFARRHLDGPPGLSG